MASIEEMDMVAEDHNSQISALKQGNRAAWSLVVDRHSHEVYGFVFHLLGGDRSLAEDLAQETWLEAVDGIDGCDEAKGTFRNWLFGIARKRVAMHYRRRAAAGNQRLLSGSGTEVEADTVQSILPNDVLEQVEQGAAVRAALLLLPLDRREVMLAKYVDGHSVKSIAARTGKTEKSVESLLTRARQQLRSILREYVARCSGGQATKEETTNE